MAGFLYYISGRHTPRTPTGEELTGWGLGHLVGAEVAIRDSTAGPDGGGQGLILAVAPETDPAGNGNAGQQAQAGYYPEIQTWVLAAGGSAGEEPGATISPAVALG